MTEADEQVQGGGDSSSDEPMETFASTFTREYPRMIALAAAVSGSRADAEDIALEAMARLDRNWGRVGSYERPGAWVRRVTINLALSRRRRIVAEARALLRLGARAPALGEAPAEHGDVWSAVADLPPRQRAVVALRYLEDRPLDEIAEILGVAPATARVHLHRAHEKLRLTLGDAGGSPADTTICEESP